METQELVTAGASGKLTYEMLELLVQANGPVPRVLAQLGCCPQNCEEIYEVVDCHSDGHTTKGFFEDICKLHHNSGAAVWHSLAVKAIALDNEMQIDVPKERLHTYKGGIDQRRWELADILSEQDETVNNIIRNVSG